MFSFMFTQSFTAKEVCLRFRSHKRFLWDDASELAYFKQNIHCFTDHPCSIKTLKRKTRKNDKNIPTNKLSNRFKKIKLFLSSEQYVKAAGSTFSISQISDLLLFKRKSSVMKFRRVL